MKDEQRNIYILFMIRLVEQRDKDRFEIVHNLYEVAHQMFGNYTDDIVTDTFVEAIIDCALILDKWEGDNGKS